MRAPRFMAALARAAAVSGAIALAGGARADSIHVYSYDPADAATRTAAGPLTFTFKKGLLNNTVINLRSTEAPATAYLRRADEHVLGHGGLSGLIGARAGERDVYEVEPQEQGEALVAAFCPGARRAWMAFGTLKLNRDLRVLVIGATAADGPPKLCRTLEFTFHGEWRLPPGRQMDPRELERPRFPAG